MELPAQTKGKRPCGEQETSRISPPKESHVTSTGGCLYFPTMGRSRTFRVNKPSSVDLQHRQYLFPQSRLFPLTRFSPTTGFKVKLQDKSSARRHGSGRSITWFTQIPLPFRAQSQPRHGPRHTPSHQSPTEGQEASRGEYWWRGIEWSSV